MQSPHKLRSSKDESSEVGMVLSSASIMIWGLVAAKAKQGISAAASSDSESVGASLRKAGTLCLLIVVASACNMFQQ